jgi:acyl-CoA thioester hydrolase
LTVRYLAPARFDDLVQIETRLVALKSRQLTFAYRVALVDTGRVLIEARTVHVVVWRATMKPTVLPTDLQVLLQPWLETASHN